MAPDRQPRGRSGTPGCASAHLGQELLGRSKNTAVRRLRRSRPVRVCSGTPGRGAWPGAGHGHAHQAFWLIFRNKLGRMFPRWEERRGNPSEACLCFVTFYVLKAATEMSLGFIFFACFPGKLLLYLHLWSRGLAYRA